MPPHPSLPHAELETVCRILAATQQGLTGSEIGSLLRQLSISDPEAGATKWKRLFAALDGQQRRDGCSNKVLQFIAEAMKPVRYTGRAQAFEARRTQLNGALAFCGVEIGEDGQLRGCTTARTLTEAEARAGRLRSELIRRTVHSDVLRYCRAELLENNCFHAVFEATKSIAEKIRQKSGLTSDGSELADEALSLGKAGMPYLAFNSLQTESELSEQKGLVNLIKGLFGTFRNPTAHAPRIGWPITEQDALDLLTMASFIHRRLDAAVRTPRQT